MILLDDEQRKLIADFLEKFALAIATAVSAKVFFAEEGLTVMTYCAIAIAVMFLVMSILFVRDTAKREESCGEDVKHGAVQERARTQRKRRNGKSAR